MNALDRSNVSLDWGHADQGPSGSVAAEQILGRVVAVERDGRSSISRVEGRKWGTLSGFAH